MSDRETKVSLSWQAGEFARISVVGAGLAFVLITFRLGDFLLKHYAEYFIGERYSGFSQLTIQVVESFVILFAVIFAVAQVRVLNIKLKIAKLEKEEVEND